MLVFGRLMRIAQGLCRPITVDAVVNLAAFQRCGAIELDLPRLKRANTGRYEQGLGEEPALRL